MRLWNVVALVGIALGLMGCAGQPAPLSTQNGPACSDESIGSMRMPEKYRTILLARFSQMDQALNEGRGYSESDNAQGFLAYGEAYILMSYVSLYRTTGNVDYLKRVVDHAKRIFSHRDDRVGAQDYAGRIRATWRSTDYADKPLSWVVHSGMIGYPIADFAQLVMCNDTLGNTMVGDTTMREFAQQAVDRLEETFQAHEMEWDEATGAYRFLTDAPFLRESPSMPLAGELLPFNHQAAMGRLLLMLYKSTGKDLYASRARRISDFFESNLKVPSRGTALWFYWLYTPRVEDFSHATVGASFATLVHRQGIGFQEETMTAMARTFTQKLVQRGHQLSFRVDGTEGPVAEPDLSTTAGLWTPLSEYDESIFRFFWNPVRDAIDAAPPRTMPTGGVFDYIGGTSMLTLAYFFQYYID